MPVKVYSGISPPKPLLDAMATASLQPSPSKPNQRPTWTGIDGDDRPPMPPRPTSGPVSADTPAVYDDAPPSYEDAMAENLDPVDGPRREYHPPDASTGESGADAKVPAQTGKIREDGPAAEVFAASGSREERRSSSESFDMLPTTPLESNSGSPPASPVRRSQSTMKVPRERVDEESPPQYQPVAESHLPASATGERRSSRNNPRPMNLGVPTRKPVPGNPNRRT